MSELEIVELVRISTGIKCLVERMNDLGERVRAIEMIVERIDERQREIDSPRLERIEKAITKERNEPEAN